MKTLSIILVTTIASFLYFNKEKSKDSVPVHSKDATTVQHRKPSLRIVVAQDVSLSTGVNGVPFINSAVFESYFNTYDRNIELNFTVISSHSTMQMITLNLLAKPFIKPQVPSVTEVSMVEKRKLKIAYLDSLQVYTKDSISYFNERTMRINKFSVLVDSICNYYQKALTHSTDLTTAFSNSDKVFNSSVQDHYENFLMLLSDGQNTSRIPVPKFKNHVTAVLVNAGGNVKTSIDSIITIQFQSPIQAINYTLK